MRLHHAALGALFLDPVASSSPPGFAKKTLSVERLEKRKENTTNIPAPINVEPSQYWDGNDGPWSSFALQVGTPAQNVRVMVSTAGYAIWTVQALGCSASGISGCEDSRGELFLANESLTWIPNSIFDLGIELNLGLNDESNYGFDTVTLGWQGSGLPTVKHSTIANMATYNFWLGSFGLNPAPANFTTYTDPQPSFMTQLKKNNTIPSLSWAYTAGNQYRFSSVFGSLVLGGYDQSKFEPTNLTIPMGADISRDLLVGVQSITSGSRTLTTNGGFYAFIDSTVPYLYLPEEVCEAFESAFGLTYNESYGLYLVNDTLHESLSSQNASVTLTLGRGTAGGQSVDITLPYSAFDLQVSWPLVDNSTRYFPLMRAANSTQYTLGRTFLQEAYLIADYERRNFTVAPCAWIQNAASDIHTIFSTDTVLSNPNNDSSLSGGAIAGVVIGIVAAVALIGLALWLWRRRKQQKQQQAVELEAKSLAAANTPDGPLSPMSKGQYGGISTPPGGELDSSASQIHEIGASSSWPNASEMDAPWRGELDAPNNHEFYSKIPRNMFEMEGNNEPIYEMDASSTQLHELEPDTRRQSWDRGDDRGDEKRYLQSLGY